VSPSHARSRPSLLVALALASCACASSSSFTRFAPPATGLRPRLVVQKAQRGSLVQSVFSGDGRVLAVSTYGEVRVLEAATGTLLASFPGRSIIRGISLSGDGKRLAIFDWNRATVHDVESGALLFELRGGRVTYEAGGTLGRTGRFLAIPRDDEAIELWDLDDGKLASRIGWDGASPVVTSFEGTRLAAANGAKVMVVDLTTGTTEVITARGEVRIVSISSDAQRIAAQVDEVLEVFDVGGARIGELPVAWAGALLGPSTVVRSEDGHRIFDPATGAELGRAPRINADHVTLSLSPDGRMLVELPNNAGEPASLALVDLTTMRAVVTEAPRAASGSSVAFDPKGELVAVGLGTELVVYERATGRVRLRVPGLSGSGEGVLAFDATGARLAVASSEGTRVLSLSKDAAMPVRSISEPALAVGFAGDRVLAFGAEGASSIGVSTGSVERRSERVTRGGVVVASGASLVRWGTSGIEVVELASGRVRSVSSVEARVVAVTADGQRIAVREEEAVAVLDPDGARISTITPVPTGLAALAFSPDGRSLALGGDAEIIVVSLDGTSRTSYRYGSWESGVFGATAIAFSADAKRVAIAVVIDGSIRVFDVEHPEAPPRVLIGHGGIVDGIAFSPDGRTLASHADDGAVKLWDPSAGAERATFVSFGADDWVVVAADGRFDGTPAAMQRLRWVRGFEALPLEALSDQLFTPRLFAQLFGTEPSNATPSTMAALEAAIAHAPGVSLTKTAEPSPDTVELVVTGTDRGGGVAELRLFHNGKRVGDDTRGMKRAGVRATFTVVLVSGDNRFTALATSTDGVESAPAELTLVRAAPTASARLHLVVVGINDYKNARYSLNYGRPDATAFAKTLEARAAKLFSKIEVHAIFDASATRSAIEEALAKVQASARPEDVFVFYFAGHGVMSEATTAEPAEFYLVPSDVTQLYGADAVLREKAISARGLRERIASIAAQKQLVVLDACQAGGAVETFAMRGAAEEKALFQLARAAGVVVLAATGSEQLAAEVAPLGHGVFTYALLKGLEGAADGGTSPDGKVTVKELEAFLADEVPALTEKYRGTAQWPQSWAKGQDFPLGLR
jgi:WD40 repeat protein